MKLVFFTILESDFKQIWKEHCENTEMLKGYAVAMHDLAIEVWDEECDGKHRIEVWT